MATQVVTQLIVDASGAKTGVAEFAASMDKAKQAAIDGGNATGQSFEAAQRRWAASLGKTDPVIRAQIKMQDELAKQQVVGNRAVELGIATQAAAEMQLAKVRAEHEKGITKLREQNGQLTASERAYSGLSKVLGGVSGQLIAMSAGAGPVGVFLSALGPWGIAASVGLGALGAAFAYVKEESSRMGAKAIELRQFADVTGLTIEQVKLLRREGAQTGVEGDTVASSFQRLTANLDDTRRASGALYDDVRRIDGGLAEQLRTTSSTADAISVLANAYKNAGDEAQKAAIARAAFGRGGTVLGPVLNSIADAGGLDRMSKSTDELSKKTDEQTRRWAQMSAQITDTEKRAKNILASIFTDEGLRLQLLAAQQMERMAKAAKDLAEARKGMSFVDKFISMSAEGGNPDAQVAARSRGIDADTITRQQEFNRAVEATEAAYDKAEPKIRATAATIRTAQDGAAAAASEYRNMVSALGSAATIQDQYAARIKELNSLFLENKITAEVFWRAATGADQDRSLQRVQAIVSILGQSATIGQQVQGKREQLQQTNTRAGGVVSQEAIDKQLELTRAQELGTIALQAQSDTLRIQGEAFGKSVGAATEYKLVQERLAEAARNNKVLTADEIAEYKNKAAEVGALAQADAQRAAQDKANFDLQTVFMSSTEKQIADVQKALHGADWESFMNDGVSASMRVAAALKDVKSAGEQFTQSLVSGLMQNKSLSESLKSAFDSLAASMASSAITSLMSGDFMGAAIKGAIAIGSKLLGGLFDDEDEKKAQKAKQAWADLKDEVHAFTTEINSSAVQALRQARAEWVHLSGAAREAGDLAGGFAMDRAFGDHIQTIIKDMVKLDDGSSDAVQAMKKLVSEVNDFRAEAEAMGNAHYDHAKLEADLVARLQQMQAAIKDTLVADINDSDGVGYLNDFAAILKKRKQLQDEQFYNGLSNDFIDRWFKGQAQKIVDGAKLSGDAFDTLLNVFPDLTGVVKANTEALEKQKLAQQQFYKGLEKDITDFINGVKFGDKSTLSPKEQFEASQSDFANKLGLARNGDQDAASDITKYASTYLDQARSYLGPSVGYAAIYDQVVTALQSLLAGTPTGMAAGGMVGNGAYNIDSVRARYAGGGDIMLAGGEFVNRATSVNSGTLPALDYINRTGRAPTPDNAPVVAAISRMQQQIAKALDRVTQCEATGAAAIVQIETQVLAAINGLRSDTRQATTETTLRANAA
jgi:hypothetical protein